VTAAGKSGALLRGALAAAAVLVALAGAYALCDWLGVRYLAEHVAQEYGPTDLLLAFLGTVLVSICGHAAWRAWNTGRVLLWHGLALLLVAALVGYRFWPGDEVTYGFFAYRTAPPPWWRDVLLLSLAVSAGIAAPAGVMCRRRTVSRRPVQSG
jgi:hypothetical protein